jgi:hypothetical protein
MRRSAPLVAATLGAFVLGAGLLVAFEKALTLAVGVALLFAFVVLGVFTIASPEYLATEEEQLPSPQPSTERKQCVD